MRNIYLLGYMGCGKSTLGPMLAQQLQYRFVDMDHEIEQEQGCSISQLFEKYGEYEFRRIEQRYLHSTAKLQRTIIATGGGTPCFFDNLDWLNEEGISIYIKLTATALAKRLQYSKQKRPLIQALSPEQLLQKITDMLHEREPIYTCASLIYEMPDNEYPTDTISQMMQMMQESNIQL